MKKYTIAILIGFFIAILAACGTEDEGTANDSASADTDSGTITVEHELDTTEVPVNPESVVVFDFGILDSIDKLGIDAVSGIAKSGTVPSYLEKYEGDEYENVGSLKEPDFEKISEINPDLIIISGRQATLFDQLSELAPTIHLAVDNENYMDSFKENMTVLGQIFGKEDEIEAELTEIDESIADLKERAEATDEKGLIILANDDKISAYGANSRFGVIHDVFGVATADEGIEASTHGMNVSFEYVMEINPDLLYVIDRAAVVTSGESSEAAQQLVENQLVENTNAYQNDNIFYLNPEYWYLSGGGLTSVTEMINQINETIE